MKRVAIVTGASRGIGKAIAERLAKDGFVAAVNYVSNAPEAEQVVAGIKAQGGEATAIKADVSDAVQVDHFLKDKSAQQIAEFTKMNPMERMGQPSDIANVVSFLAGPDGGWINSQVLLANGGFAY